MSTYTVFTQQLIQEGFTRVERDDRLLDVYTKENREKGVELWQAWDEEIVRIVRIRLPFNEKNVTRHDLRRVQLEKDLLDNTEREKL
ncbi:MAG: hypothetical protein WEC84_05155 [Candidatus Andersenbacteria bacterium]